MSAGTLVFEAILGGFDSEAQRSKLIERIAFLGRRILGRFILVFLRRQINLEGRYKLLGVNRWIIIDLYDAG